MRISPFFHQLRAAYQAELDDLASDSEGKDVLQQRLQQKRGELKFLLQMIEFSPEMVAVIFHQGFQFKSPAAMEHLLGHESDDFPDWDTLSPMLQLTPWAQALAQQVLKEPLGEWFLTVAAGLEYMHTKPDAIRAEQAEDDGDDEDGSDAGEDGPVDPEDAQEEKEARERAEAGADWMVEQGFDRKD
jgi:hypothetical protein